MSGVVVEITDDRGTVIAPDALAAAEHVHRQLRPRLHADYARQMARVFACGARMMACMQDGSVVGVAIYRVYENTAEGIKLYVDDLVTDQTRRSQGVGKRLLDALKAKARAHGAQSFALDSGVQRAQAHKFYFREGLVVTSFSFKQHLEE